MNTLTRKIISDKFSLTKLEDHSVYNKEDLFEKIDLWKYILVDQCNAKEQESILIGITTLSIDYFAICFASLELSLKIVIVDYNRKDDFSTIEYKDPKTKALSPIDIFLHDVDEELFQSGAKAINKFKFFTTCSKRTYNIKKLNHKILDDNKFQVIQSVVPKKESIAIRCTSSGTTGTPKIVEHSHEFLYKISLRNSSKFSGDCLHIRNLNHGSSIAVFLLPSLMNDKVNNHLVFNVDEGEPFDKFVEAILPYRESMHFINFPYPYMIDEFINSNIKKEIKWPNLKVQTLSYIQQKSKDAIREGIFESITSIFGSNETSGPVFECTIGKDNIDMDSSKFKKLDDFYSINLDSEGLISIGMPVYNNSIVTNDIFKFENGYYVHSGRKDMVKLNGEIIDYNIINNFNKDNADYYLIIDSLQNSLYVAFWNLFDEELLEKINDFLKNNYKRIKVDKHSVLNKNDFMSGIKMDNELLREHFRTNV